MLVIMPVMSSTSIDLSASSSLRHEAVLDWSAVLHFQHSNCSRSDWAYRTSSCSASCLVCSLFTGQSMRGQKDTMGSPPPSCKGFKQV